MAKHITEQQWILELTNDGSGRVFLVGAEDKTIVALLQRPDRDSSLFMAGYIAALQAAHLREKK